MCIHPVAWVSPLYSAVPLVSLAGMVCIGVATEVNAEILALWLRDFPFLVTSVLLALSARHSMATTKKAVQLLYPVLGSWSLQKNFLPQ